VSVTLSPGSIRPSLPVSIRRASPGYLRFRRVAGGMAHQSLVEPPKRSLSRSSRGSVFIIAFGFIRRSALKDLAAVRKHAASGHRWDVTRGQWIAWGIAAANKNPAGARRRPINPRATLQPPARRAWPDGPPRALRRSGLAPGPRERRYSAAKGGAARRQRST
jgi:hypothetical protein